MTELITTMFSGFTQTMGSFANGIKEGFTNVIYVDPTASELVVSDLAKFGFLVGGVALALGVTFFIIRKVRG